MNQSFCSLFWRHLAPDTSGNVKVCCISTTTVNKEDGTPYNFGYDDINDIFHSQAYKEIRELALQGKPITGCDECYTTESFGGYSNRLFYNSISNIDVDNPKLNYLDLRLGNKCNLACRSCSPESSSLLAKELGKDLVIDAWFTTDTFKNNISNQLEHINAYYLTGGEPTIIKENQELLNTLIDSGKTDTHIIINTNLASYNTKFYELLSNFKSVAVNISIDGIGELQEYIRYPSKWKVIERNLQRILEFDFQVIATPVIQLNNLNRCVELFDYFENYNRLASKQVIKILPIDLVYPDQLDLIHLPKDFKLMCWERIQKWLDETNQYCPELPEKLKSVKNKCFSDIASGVKDYVDFNATFDINRRMSLADANPELAAILEVSC